LLVDQTNVAELARAMRQLLEDHGMHSSLAGRARERWFRSWPEYVTRLVGYLHDQEPAPLETDAKLGSALEAAV
jgi:hypothetical protein